MATKSKKELEIENAILRRTGFGSNAAKVLIALIQCGAGVAVFYFLNDSIKHLAGQETNATINIDFMGNVLAGLFGGGGVVYGKQQNELRKKTIERLQKRIKELEGKIDNSRSTSGLTERGETHPEDI
jgi:hypothetical protein